MRILGKMFRCIGGILWLGAFVYGFFAFFFTQKIDGVLCDGLGRELWESPLFMRMVFREERVWAGWVWCLVDCVAFMGALVLGYFLFVLGGELNPADPPKKFKAGGDP